jgi:two-component system NarL family response regulator
MANGLVNTPAPHTAASRSQAAGFGARAPLERLNASDLVAEDGADTAFSIEELLRSNEAFRSRVRELAAANEGLRREVTFAAGRLQTLMSELALAAERVGNRSLASVIREIAAAASAVSAAAVCGPGSHRPCVLHGDRACALCRAIGTVEPLSGRERDVLRLLTEGSRSPSIAAHLGISIATVEVHRRNIMRKLGLHTVADLTRYAIREGLTSL